MSDESLFYSGMDESELEPPPSYQEVIKSRNDTIITDRKYIKPGKPEAQSSPHQDYFIRSNHVTDRITSGQSRSRVNPIRPTRDRIHTVQKCDDVISSSNDVIKSGNNLSESRDIPYIDEVPSTPQLPNHHVTNRGSGDQSSRDQPRDVPLRQKNRQTVREHRNSYIRYISLV